MLKKKELKLKEELLLELRKGIQNGEIKPVSKYFDSLPSDEADMFVFTDTYGGTYSEYRWMKSSPMKSIFPPAE